MSSRQPPGKAGLINAQFQPLLYNPLYNMGSAGDQEVHLGSTVPNFYSRNLKSIEEEDEEEGVEPAYGVGKSAVAAAAAAAQAMGGDGGPDGGRVGPEAEVGMKRWGGYEQERAAYTLISPLVVDQGPSAAAAAVDFLPMAASSGSASYSFDAAHHLGSGSCSTAAKYSTQDLEILTVKQPLNAGSGPVQPNLYDHILSSLPHPPPLGISASFQSSSSFPTNPHAQYIHTHTPGPPPSYSFPDPNLQLFGDHHHHHQWNGAGSHPNAELLLLPGVSDHPSAAPASLHTQSAALPSSRLDLLHASSLHDKQAQLHQQLPLGMGAAGGGGHAAPGQIPSAAAAQMWHIDKLDMAVGLGLHDHAAAAARSASLIGQELDHFEAAQRHGHGTQPGLSLFLQSSHQRAQTALSLDAARYSARSATGSVGVLRNSKYLKAAQQLLNEFCNVCRDVFPEGRGSMQAATQERLWSAGARVSNGEADRAMVAAAGGDQAHLLHRVFFSASQKDMGGLYSNAQSYCKSSSMDQQACAQSKQLKPASDHNQEKLNHEHLAGIEPSSSSLPDNPPAAIKQLPADERCHLQMRKTRLIAMVEELDRRYQQYRDQMQLIVTSFESATGMGAAAAYTTLARKAMSRQFRGLRDAIGEHIRKVCKMLGEEISSVPILSRGETPRLRLVDQRLRHQRSLQQIGMLPQQQAWRPQRGLPERSVSVLRAWLFEHFLHPYPKDSEKAMLARLTGLSRNQVSNWFINARVRLWKPMIEEMYVEESKAMELSEAQASHAAAAEAAQGKSGAAGDQSSTIQSDHSSCQSWQQASSSTPAPTSAASASFTNPQAGMSFYSARPLHMRDDLNTFMHLHSHSSTRGNGAQGFGHGATQGVEAAAAASHQYPWMKGMQVELPSPGDIGVLTQRHDHLSLQAAAYMQGQLGTASMKNGVSLTLGLQQPPPHSSYHVSNSAYGCASEALLF